MKRIHRIASHHRICTPALPSRARSLSTVHHPSVMPIENLSICRCRLNHPLQASPVQILPLRPHASASVWRRAGRRDEQRRRHPSRGWRGWRRTSSRAAPTVVAATVPSHQRRAALTGVALTAQRLSFRRVRLASSTSSSYYYWRGSSASTAERSSPRVYQAAVVENAGGGRRTRSTCTVLLLPAVPRRPPCYRC